jgi:hypothetical protein
LPKDGKVGLLKKQVEPDELVVSIVRAAVPALVLREGYPEAQPRKLPMHACGDSFGLELCSLAAGARVFCVGNSQCA